MSLAPVAVAASMMTTGLLISLLAKAFLRRSFGIVAASRGVRRGGPYQLVRHPMYSGYVVTQMGFLLLNPSLWNAAVYALAWTTLVMRIGEEEKFLSQDIAYRGLSGGRALPIDPGDLLTLILLVGGVTGNGSGAIGTPSSRKLSASAGLAWPWIERASASPRWIARASSGKRAPTCSLVSSIFVCAFAMSESIAFMSESALPLAPTRGRHRCLIDVGAAANRASDEAPAALRLIILTGGKPGFENMALRGRI